MAHSARVTGIETPVRSQSQQPSNSSSSSDSGFRRTPGALHRHVSAVCRVNLVMAILRVIPSLGKNATHVPIAVGDMSVVAMNLQQRAG
jgi:hypothetical protein